MIPACLPTVSRRIPGPMSGRGIGHPWVSIPWTYPHPPGHTHPQTYRPPGYHPRTYSPPRRKPGSRDIHPLGHTHSLNIPTSTPLPRTYPPLKRHWYNRCPPPWKGHGTRDTPPTPPTPREQTDTCENIIILQLRLRAVNINSCAMWLS